MLYPTDIRVRTTHKQIELLKKAGKTYEMNLSQVVKRLIELLKSEGYARMLKAKKPVPKN